MFYCSYKVRSSSFFNIYYTSIKFIYIHLFIIIYNSLKLYSCIIKIFIIWLNIFIIFYVFWNKYFNSNYISLNNSIYTISIRKCCWLSLYYSRSYISFLKTCYLADKMFLILIFHK